MDQIAPYMKTLRSKIDTIAVLQQAEEKTQIKKEYLASAILLTLTLVTLFLLGSSTICLLIGLIYPSYHSFLTIESKHAGRNNNPNSAQWLIYWIIYSTFTLLETFIVTLLHWIPFYYAFKLSFLVWCMSPQTKGATFVYNSFLKDFLKSNEEGIDEALEKAKAGVGKVVKEGAKVGEEVYNKTKGL